MANRNFVRVPKNGFVPNTSVRGSFNRATSIGLALERAGIASIRTTKGEFPVRLPLVGEAQVRIPARG